MGRYMPPRCGVGGRVGVDGSGELIGDAFGEGGGAESLVCRRPEEL